MLCAIALVLFAAFGFAVCQVECQYDEIPYYSLYSDTSVMLGTYSSAADCLSFSKSRGVQHAAVAFDKSTGKCCAALVGAYYSFVYDYYSILFVQRVTSKSSTPRPNASPSAQTQPRTQGASSPSSRRSSPAHDQSATTSTYGNYRIFYSSTTWTVPYYQTVYMLLCIGGGGSGGMSYYTRGGGGSGYISYYRATGFSAGWSYSVVVGAGGVSGASGNSSSIGGYVFAQGGNAADTWYGAAGGSGGGAGAYTNGYPSHSGGSGGSNGGFNPAYQNSGGPGANNWDNIKNMLPGVTLLYGAGGAGIAGNATTMPGGGGGGGIIVNGNYIYAGIGDGPSGVAGKPGQGFGAGGGGGGYYDGNYNYKGGAGANGVCIIAW